MPTSSVSGTAATVQGTSGTVANHLGASASAAATTRRACSSISSRLPYRIEGSARRSKISRTSVVAKSREPVSTISSSTWSTISRPRAWSSSAE